MKNIIYILSSVLISTSATAKTVRYDLTVTQKPVNLSGKKTVDFSIMVNGQIPAPTLEFTEGDEAEILVKNEIPTGEEVSIHWHGLLLPPIEDGVAYVNTPPIYKGQSRLFKFKIRQHGTYWYHSHTMLQEQKGVYGAFIIQPKNRAIKADKEAVAVLSDWSDENADQILKNLRKDGDYYLFKKNSLRSYWNAIQSGGLKSHLKNEWSRMGGMDLSDVGYDSFLINGKMKSQLVEAKPGERVRVRIINAGASSYFYISLGDLPFTVVSADGVDIAPIETKEILMGMAETYDIVFTVPENKNYELRATVQDVTGYASTWLGTPSGSPVPAANKPMPNMYAEMDHSAHAGHVASGNHSDHIEHSQNMNHSEHHGHKKVSAPIIQSVSVDNIKSHSSTNITNAKSVREVKLVLGGDMERYVWHINGKAMFQDQLIQIEENDLVRFTIVNDTMMHHPMHLHGHFFRVLNQYGEFSPLKHTVDVAPHTTRTIEFFANEPGQWMLHCHNLYHMKTGMARIVKYSTWEPSSEMKQVAKKDPHLHDHWYFYGRASGFSNMGELFLRTSQTWNQLEARIEARDDDDWDAEGDVFYRRWHNANLNFVLGGTSTHFEKRPVAGIGYLLPMLIESQVLVDDHGEWRIDIEKKFQWTKYWYSEYEYTWRSDDEFDSEFLVSLMYARQWNWAAGFRYTGHSIGVGFDYQF